MDKQDKRRAELLDLSSYIQTVDNDVTMILQSLQWDRKHLIEATPLASCSYDNNHRVPADKLKDHEKDCLLRILGYSKADLLLPDPPDGNAATLVKLSNDDITNIIEYAAKVDPVFKKGRGPGPGLPLSLARLQHEYSSDERRAVHDAVVSAAPACHDLGELALLGDNEAQSCKQKSRAEILAELRDMRRRRTKYRGAGKTRNYSDVIRDLIATQMEHYSIVQDGNSTNNSENDSKSKTEKPKQFTDHIKKEPLDGKSYSAGNETKRNPSKEYENYYRDKSKDESRHRYVRDESRHNDRSREKYNDRETYDDYNKQKHRDSRRRDERDRQSTSSKDRSRDRKDYTSDKYREDSRRNNYKDRNSSRNESRHNRDYDKYEKPYKEEKHKRYYEYKLDELSKRIKQEKIE